MYYTNIADYEALIANKDNLSQPTKSTRKANKQVMIINHLKHSSKTSGMLATVIKRLQRPSVW